jgi:chemotaxis protein MotA
VIILLGLVTVFGSIVLGYTMHHGHLAVLVQTSEFIIIGGAATGALLVANPPAVIKGIARQVIALLKPNPFNQRSYAELLQALYELFQTARRDGLIGVERHIENPAASDLFQKYPTFRSQSHALAFLTDTLKVLLTGTIEEHHLSEILDLDLERQHEEAMTVPQALTRLGDAMPGFGIVAAVLGVIITMGAISGPTSEIGAKVAAALVGTMLGILLSYGLVGPIAQAIESRIRAEQAYFSCIRTALLAFARGDSPTTAVEFARRSIDPVDRPSFAALEALVQRKAA